MESRNLTRQERGLIVTLNFNLSGMEHQKTMLLEDIAGSYTDSFQMRLLEAHINGSDETVGYNSKYPHQPVSGSITGHVDDDDQFEVEAENELDEIWNGGGSMKFTEEDWGW